MMHRRIVLRGGGDAMRRKVCGDRGAENPSEKDTKITNKLKEKYFMTGFENYFVLHH